MVAVPCTPEGVGVTFSEHAESEMVPMPKVRRGCRRCGVTLRDIASGYVVVSSSGIAHHGSEDFGGQTQCGIDATGDGWWWPL